MAQPLSTLCHKADWGLLRRCLAREWSGLIDAERPACAYYIERYPARFPMYRTVLRFPYTGGYKPGPYPTSTSHYAVKPQLFPCDAGTEYACMSRQPPSLISIGAPTLHHGTSAQSVSIASVLYGERAMTEWSQIGLHFIAGEKNTS